VIFFNNLSEKLNESYNLLKNIYKTGLFIGALFFSGFNLSANAIVANVSTWPELFAALSNSAVTEVNVLDNITSQANFFIQAFPGNTFTLNGNGNTLDGANSFFGFYTNMNTLNINDVTMQNFTNNSLGGAIRGYQTALVINVGPGSAFINNSTVGGNGSGGAIYNAGSAVNIADNVLFSGNVANGQFGSGGAINASNLTIGNDVTFSGNQALGTSSAAGGAISSFGTLAIGDGVIFENNSVNTSGSALGGAISFGTGTMSITTTGGTTLFTGNTVNGTPNDIDLFGFSGVDPTTLNINGNSGEVIFNGGISSSFDQTHTLINKTNGGTVIFGPDAVNSNFLGTYNQTGGTTTYFGQVLAGINNITNSNLNLFQTTSTISINNLNLTNANVDSINGIINTFNIATFSANGLNNFAVDINGETGTSDQFVLGTTTGTGTLNIDLFNVISAPTAVTIDLPIFTGDVAGLTFTSSETELDTPIYIYHIESLGNGVYRLFRATNETAFNPKVFRGQVATMAAYYNQLVVNNVLFDHVYLDSEVYGASNENPNRYAQLAPLFAPYQYRVEEGSIWYKNYFTVERLFMTQDLNVDNRAYGSIVGADFPAQSLENGWKFLPTAYIAYNGGHQTFNGVSMYQNGGQGGFLGTFKKKDFLCSILAYGGGYNNEMSLNGVTDHTGNWFAGTAVKSAYNHRAAKHWIIQPNFLISYNIFGNQHWGSDFGAISMVAGYLNGINLAPGLNIIYGREDWSVYSTMSYVYNINDKLNGSADGVHLPNVMMRHGYFEIGGGVLRRFKERLLAYGQVVLREGGRRGVGFQAGISWIF